MVGWIKAGWCEVVRADEDIGNWAQSAGEDEIDTSVGRCLIRKEVFAVQGQGEAGIIGFGDRPGVRHRGGDDVIGAGGCAGSAIEIASVGRSRNVELVDFKGKRIGKTKLSERGLEGR